MLRVLLSRVFTHICPRADLMVFPSRVSHHVSHTTHGHVYLFFAVIVRQLTVAARACLFVCAEPPSTTTERQLLQNAPSKFSKDTTTRKLRM